jgi:DNA-binding response OmpR family regulator
MKKILLIEPDNKIAKLISSSLTQSGYDVKIASNSQTAILIADKINPDLVVLELAIKDQNGIAFIHELRSYSEWAKTPVLVHTNMLVESEILDSLLRNLAVSAYLYKPETSLATLKVNIARALES